MPSYLQYRPVQTDAPATGAANIGGLNFSCLFTKAELFPRESILGLIHQSQHRKSFASWHQHYNQSEAGETGTRLSPPIRRRLLSRFFLREGDVCTQAYRVQNVPGNSAKTSLAWLHFKTDHALRREENNPGWVLRRTISWWKSSLPPRKESWAFYSTFSFDF